MAAVHSLYRSARLAAVAGYLNGEDSFAPLTAHPAGHMRALTITGGSNGN
jgi:hypothetical protein